MRAITKQAQVLLDDAGIYLDVISDAAYSTSLSILSGSSVGQHTRHFIEFFQCIIRQEESIYIDDRRVVSYDRRSRDRMIEQDVVFARLSIDQIRRQLIEMDCEEPLWLEYVENEAGKTTLIDSSFERELFYNIEHAIHHFALIKIGLQQVCPDLELPPHFGVAPSTLSFRKQKQEVQLTTNA